MLLKRMGIELGVFEACNGKQALEYLTSDKKYRNGTYRYTAYRC